MLFDEIEKASDKVRNLLLQILDDGILTDSKGKTVKFDRSLVLLTSNVGVEEIERASSRCGFGNTAKRSFDARSIRELTNGALKENFRPEFLNRLDELWCSAISRPTTRCGSPGCSWPTSRCGSAAPA